MSNLQYKDTPIEPVRFGPNGQPHVVSRPDLVSDVEVKPPVRDPPPPSRRQKATEIPVQRDLLTDQLVATVNQVFKVVTERIAYHEAEAARLRASLKPYSEFAAPVTEMSPDEAYAALVEMAKTLPRGDQP